VASVTGITAAKALDILGQSVVSGAINGSGHLILTRSNGQTIDAGDFSTIIGTLIDAEVAAEVPVAVNNQAVGTVFAKGNTSGVVSFSGITNLTLVNATITATLTGNITVDAANFPANPKPGTQFAMRLTQDATGGRTLTLTGIKRSQGVLTLSTAANAIDIITFYYDGTNWYAGAMGLAFS
jgi:hypothetical protein